jgi:predicted HAD superfamily phosphohydrolase YqeG
LVVSFLVVSVDDFLVVVDFLVVDVFAGDFSGIVVVLVSLLLVQAPIRPAANRTVNE